MAANSSTAASLLQFTALFSELNDLKRQRVAGRSGSFTEQFFVEGWGELLQGKPPSEVAIGITRKALVSARLGGIGDAELTLAGLSHAEITEVFHRSLRAVENPIEAELRDRLHADIDASFTNSLSSAPLPPFVKLLSEQPRAGATRPGRARILVLPPESHADHCVMVAVYAVLLAPYFEAEPGLPFLAAMSHHFHNAYLPDAGFTGEEMLGEQLGRVMHRLQELAIQELPPFLQGSVRKALQTIATADTAAGQTFHAADVLDRVLQMKWYEQAAQFTLSQALDDMELVHAGPVQVFHKNVLRDAGLW